MKIEVNIESQLQELWAMVGLSAEEIEKEYEDINDRIQELFRIILKENIRRVRDLAQEAESAEAKLLDTLRDYGLDGVYHLENQLPLKRRIEKANEMMTSLQDELETQKKEFKYLYDDLTEKFNILEIKPEDRGNFEEEGNNYSKARIGRMTELCTTMKGIISKRQTEMDELCKKINEYNERLGAPPIERPKTLGDPTFKRLKKERNQLAEKVKQNQKEGDELIAEIRSAESTLKIQPREIADVQNFTQSDIDSLNQYHQELIKQRESRRPELISDAKERLRELWKELHIITPKRESFPFMYNDSTNDRTLTALNSEIERLESMKDSIQPMLDLCNERDEIIRESERLSRLANRSDRLTSRKIEMANSLVAEEKSRKKLAVDLPRINNQLVPMLKGFQDTFGEPFLWDGNVLIDEVLQQIKDYEEEKSLMDSKIQRRNSPSKSKITRSPNSSFSPRSPK